MNLLIVNIDWYKPSLGKCFQDNKNPTNILILNVPKHFNNEPLNDFIFKMFGRRTLNYVVYDIDTQWEKLEYEDLNNVSIVRWE